MLVFETTFKNGLKVYVKDNSSVADLDNYCVGVEGEEYELHTNSPREVFRILTELQSLEVEE